MSYKISRSKDYHGICPPGYEKVEGYKKKDGTFIKSHCRKITVNGRNKAIFSGLLNEGLIAEENTRLTMDSIIDSTKNGEKNAEKIEKRAIKVQGIMKDQEVKKEEIRNKKGDINE